MFDYLTSLNNHNLPYSDTVHPIVVHFVIAMVVFAFVCDVIGYFTRNHRLFEVSWWNMLFATVSIFIAIMFGQFEAGLAEPYDAAQPVLNLHTLLGWSLSAILASLTAWRYVIRYRTPQKISIYYLAAGLLLTVLVGIQVYFGDKLVWVYGLHTVPVIEAMKEGLLQ